MWIFRAAIVSRSPDRKTPDEEPNSESRPSSEIELAEDSKGLLEENLNFYRALDTGERVPTTPAQEHFVAVCSGNLAPETSHEVAYMQFKQLLEMTGTTEDAAREMKDQIDVMRIKGVGPGTLEDAAKEAGVSATGRLHRVEPFTQPVGETSNRELNDRRQQILDCLKDDSQRDIAQIASQLGLSNTMLDREIDALVRQGKLEASRVVDVDLLSTVQRVVADCVDGYRQGVVTSTDVIQIKARLEAQLMRPVPHLVIKMAWPDRPACRRDAVLEQFLSDGEVDAEFLGDQFGRAKSTIEGDLESLIKDGQIDYKLVTNNAILQQLREEVLSATKKVWGEKEHLKPLKQYLEEIVGYMVPYHELKVALHLEGIQPLK